MAQRVVDLSLLIEDNMPAHKLFQRPVITTHLSHETSKAFNLGVPRDAMTFQTNFIASLDQHQPLLQRLGYQVGGKQIELVARQRRQQFVVQRTAQIFRMHWDIPARSVGPISAGGWEDAPRARPAREGTQVKNESG